jgi:hypothetical protein
MSQVDQFTVKSRVKSVTASQAVRHNEMLKTSFPMKHHLDYPDYKTSNEITRFVPTAKDKNPE